MRRAFSPNAERAKVTDRQIAFALALFLLAVYLSTVDLRFQSIDEVAVFSLARSLVGHGGFDVDGLFWTKIFTGVGTVVARGADGHLYSLKDPGLSIIITPLVALGYGAGVSPIRTAFLISPILTALTGALLFQAGRWLGYGRRASALGVLTFGLATMAWPYAETLFTQPLAAFSLMLATWTAIRAKDRASWRAGLIAGLGMGLASTAGLAMWIILPVYALYLLPLADIRTGGLRSVIRRAFPQIVAFGAGVGLFVLLEILYNVSRFGGPLATGHTETSGLAFSLSNFVMGSIGQLISLPRGVVWYAPVVLIVPAGAALLWRSRRDVVLLISGQAVLIFLLYSSWYDWGGGLAWGPRFLVPLMPLLMLLAVPLYERLMTGDRQLAAKLAVGAVVILSFGMQLGAALVDATYSQRDIFLQLRSVTEQGSFAARWAALTDALALPVVRLVETFAERRWGVLFMAHGVFDWPLLLGALLLAAMALSWLWLARRGAARRTITYGLLAQTVLTVAFASLMLWRYPHAPNGYLSPEMPGPETLPEVTRLLDEHARPGDGIVLLMPEDYISWMDAHPNGVPEMNFFLETPLGQESAEMLSAAESWYDRVWLVSTGTMRGNWANGVELWLARSGHMGNVLFESDSLSLLSYTFPTEQMPELTPVSIHYGEGGEVLLSGYSWELVRRSDAAWINVRLQWEAVSTPPGDYTVTVQMWDVNGLNRAQHDAKPLASYAPTSTWEPGTVIDDLHSVELPLDLPPGGYSLYIGLYDGYTGEVIHPQGEMEYFTVPIQIPPSP